MQSSDRRGVALLAICVSTIVLAIGLSVVIPRAEMKVRRAREETLRFQLSELRRAVAKFVRCHERQPLGIDELLQDESGNRFLRKAYLDPFTGQSDWVIELNEDGIVFFRSASDKKSISGIAYSMFR